MAKGNLFLGTAARSVGDVVMYRREGSQVSRVRVRKIANPRTDAQSLQRAAFSPVAKFFSPLAVVLERAWEGVSKSKSYSEFLKENVKRARVNGWLLPKGTGFFPLPYQLTKGTLPALPISKNASGTSFIIFDGADIPATAATIGAVSTILVGQGYQNGDVFTLIAVSKDANGNYIPGSMQFTIDTTSTAEMSTVNTALAQVNVDENTFYIGSTYGQGCVAACAMIARFENEKWRRSTQEMLVVDSLMTEISTDAYKAAAVASYGNTAGSINPLVYLDGKDLED